MKAKLHRIPLHWWTLQYAVISRSVSGNYYCSLVCKFPVNQEVQKPVEAETAIGLKYSYKHLYVDSNGGMEDPPLWVKESQEKLANMQRKIARMQRGSNNYFQMLQRYRRLTEHIVNQRKDYIHKESRRITNAWNAVCIRSDDYSSLSQAIKLVNVLDSAFGTFRSCLDYKLKWAGKVLIPVEKGSPTTMRCHVCGTINEEIKRGISSWSCLYCGSLLDREFNAAFNIKAQGLA